MSLCLERLEVRERDQGTTIRVQRSFRLPCPSRIRFLVVVGGRYAFVLVFRGSCEPVEDAGTASTLAAVPPPLGAPLAQLSALQYVAPALGFVWVIILLTIIDDDKV